MMNHLFTRGGRLGRHLLLRGRLQRPHGLRLAPQLLDAVEDQIPVDGEGSTERLRPVQVRRHLSDDLWKEGERDEAGLEAGLDSRVLELRAAQRLVVRRQPLIEFLDLRRVCGAQQDLGDQSIRIQRDPRHQLVDAHGGRGRLRLPGKHQVRNEHQDGRNGDSGFHEEPLHTGR